MVKNQFTDIFFKETIFTDFYFFNIGYEKCEQSHSFGPTLREYYIIHFITSGKGIYKTDNITYSLAKGEFFIIKPGELTYYEADSEDPWEYYWFGFSGKKAEEILSINGMNNKDYTGKVINFNQTIKKLNHLLNMNFFDNRYKLTYHSALIDVFSNFKITQEKTPIIKQANQKQKYRESFLLYVHNNYHRSTLSINEIAKSMYLDPSYFSQVIRDELGITAQSYLSTFRLEQAKRLLRTTELSIDEITSAVGYGNRHSFSRAFKNKFSQTPSQFRKRE